MFVLGSTVYPVEQDRQIATPPDREQVIQFASISEQISHRLVPELKKWVSKQVRHIVASEQVEHPTGH